jgi:hypothetical protein
MRVFTVLLASLAAQSCTSPRALWVEDGSREDHLIIGHSTKRGGAAPAFFSTLLVEECGIRPHEPGPRYWAVSQSESHVEYPTRITYGVTPKGFRIDTGPRPLHPGCFHISTVELRTTVDIQGDGRVIERPDRKFSEH